MSDSIKNILLSDDGMALYEYIVNHSADGEEEMQPYVDRLREVDRTGQFLCSSARFLHALSPEHFHAQIKSLIEGAIDRDRERRYIGSLLEAIWGKDYQQRADELRNSDDIFRRIYKRIYNNSIV